MRGDGGDDTTITMGRKAWRDLFEYEQTQTVPQGKSRSVTLAVGEQVIVDLSLPDYAVRREQQPSGRANK